MSDFARGATEGTRVVIRYRLHNEENSATDAVGYVSAKNATHIVIATVRGLTTIAFDDVILAKEVPPPPPRAAS
jgi:hypothetical protein